MRQSFLRTHSARLAPSIAIKSQALFRIGARLPLVRRAAAAAYGSYFGRATGEQRLFRGVYRDFASATADIPRGRDVGFDNAASAQRLLRERDVVNTNDYPALFWLGRILSEGSATIFDWGGYVGTTYLVYRRYLTFPRGLTWIVNDVPAVVVLGQKLAACENLTSLQFTTGFEPLEKADILLAAGSLQFIEDPFGRLKQARSLPRYAVVNKTPIYEREQAVTLQNFGTAIAPYHLFNRQSFLSEFDRLGYQLRDAWEIPGHGCQIPFFPEHSLAAYSGMFFERRC
jgi:putative methyltransferase (TIGR04325 family)